MINGEQRDMLEKGDVKRREKRHSGGENLEERRMLREKRDKNGERRDRREKSHKKGEKRKKLEKMET